MTGPLIQYKGKGEISLDDYELLTQACRETKAQLKATIPEEEILK